MLCSGTWFRLSDWYLQRQLTSNKINGRHVIRNKPFWAPVIIISLDVGFRFLETDIIKTSEGCAIYILYCMIWNEKMLFPSHKYIVCVRQGFIIEGIWIKRFWVLTKWSKLALKNNRCYIYKTLNKLRPTQCFLSTSSSASHLRVKNGYFWLMISPSKNVVSVGYSSVSPFICKYPHRYEFSSSTCCNQKTFEFPAKTTRAFFKFAIWHMLLFIVIQWSRNITGTNRRGNFSFYFDVYLNNKWRKLKGQAREKCVQSRN